MARPGAEILISNDSDECCTEVLAGTQLWVVLYRRRHFSLRRKYWSAQDLVERLKYERTTYTNQAHAYRLAQRLNKMFNCQDFSVRIVD